jgi:hypothetical protein
MRRVLSFVLFNLLLLPALTASAAESVLIIESSAVDKALRLQFFTDQGRYWLSNRDVCNQASLESPQTQISGGRVQLRVTFSGRFGAKSGDKCLGGGDTFEVTASGRPFYRDGRLGLEDIRIDTLSNEFYRLLLQPMMATLMPGVLDINLKEAAMQAVAGRTAPYQVEMENLTVTNWTAEADRLTLQLQFVLRVR